MIWTAAGGNLWLLVLHIMIEGHNNLPRIMYLRRADGHEFRGHRPRVVVCHACRWFEDYVVALLDYLVLG